VINLLNLDKNENDLDDYFGYFLNENEIFKKGILSEVFV
jgi:hypothetical protein